MSINIKLLSECFDAVLAGDMKTAQRKFKNNWDRTAQRLMEGADFDSEQDDAEIEATVDQVMADEEENEANNFDDILAAIAELEGKFPTEMTDEIQARFDELKNRIDDLRLADDEDEDSDACDEAFVALDDLKGDFELADGMTDDVIDLFNEIGEKLSECFEDFEDESMEDDSEDETEEELDIVEESEKPTLSEEGEPDFDADAKELDKPEEDKEVLSDEPKEEDEDEAEVDDDRSTEEVVMDAKADAEKLASEMDALLDKAKNDELEEGFKAYKGDSIKKEKAGVEKQSMNMPRPARIDSDAKMGASKENSAGKSAKKQINKCAPLNPDQAPKWKPIPHRNARAEVGKSVMG